MLDMFSPTPIPSAPEPSGGSDLASAFDRRYAASNRGSCQFCGAVQKLPRGIVAKHGHTVAGSMFHGTCPGSDKLPFEVSHDHCHEFITRTRTEVARLEEQSARLMLPATESSAWIHEYRPVARRQNNGGGFVWHYCAIRRVDALRLCYRDERGTEVAYPLALDFSDLNDACTKLNLIYRERVVLKEIARTWRYIEWQEQRVASWAPEDLLPLNPDDATEQKSFFERDLGDKHR